MRILLAEDDPVSRHRLSATLTKWGKRIALGVGAVTEFYCTDDSSGMNTAIAASEAAIRAVTSA